MFILQLAGVKSIEIIFIQELVMSLVIAYAFAKVCTVMSRTKQKGSDDNTVVVSKISSPYKIKLNVLGPLIGLVFILVAAFIFYKIEHRHSPQNLVAGPACSSTASGNVLQQAAGEISSTNVVQLQTSVTKIMGLPNYQQDPNCLYVIVKYYLVGGNGSQAQKYLTLLNKVYNPAVGYSSKLGSPTDDPSVLQEEVNVANQTSAQIQSQALQQEQQNPIIQPN